MEYVLVDRYVNCVRFGDRYRKLFVNVDWIGLLHNERDLQKNKQNQKSVNDYRTMKDR